MKLYSGPLSMFGAKAQIALAEKNVPFELEMVPFSLATRYEPKHPEVLRVNPKGQVPVLIDDRVELFDSTQIFEYLEDRFAEPNLWPRDPSARARARLREVWSDEIFFPNVATLISAAGSRESEAARAADASIRRLQCEADDWLADGPYLAGDFTYADIAFFMAQFFAWFLGIPVTPETKRLAAWWETVGARPAVRGVVDPMSEFLGSAGLIVPDLI